MQVKDLKKFNISDKPGVYFFKKGKDILYIGKATSLRDRTKSYFNKDLIATRGPMILDMVVQADKIDWQETDNVLEALILEAELIKKHLPKYNVREKDDRSWNYVCITREEIPKVIIKRGKELREAKKNSLSLSAAFGPYTNGGQLKEAMKIVRRIFPYLDEHSVKKNNQEFYRQIGLIPDIASRDNAFSNGLAERTREEDRGPEKKQYLEGLKEYKENIRNLKLFFQGKKKKIIHNLRKQSEENRRHILHITIFAVGIIMVLLWTYSLGRSIASPDTKIKIKQDLQPFSVLKDNLVGGYKSVSGQNSN